MTKRKRLTGFADIMASLPLDMYMRHYTGLMQLLHPFFLVWKNNLATLVFESDYYIAIHEGNIEHIALKRTLQKGTEIVVYTSRDTYVFKLCADKVGTPWMYHIMKNHILWQHMVLSNLLVLQMLPYTIGNIVWEYAIQKQNVHLNDVC